MSSLVSSEQLISWQSLQEKFVRKQFLVLFDMQIFSNQNFTPSQIKSNFLSPIWGSNISNQIFNLGPNQISNQIKLWFIILNIESNPIKFLVPNVIVQIFLIIN